MLRKRALIFALLSVFLEDTQFIPLLLNVLQPNMRTRVCTVINNNIAHEWTLARIASELLMSPSLLKKNCAKKVRHIHSCLLSVGCSVLYNLLLYMGFQLSELQYPVDITACRISFTFFEIIMGWRPQSIRSDRRRNYRTVARRQVWLRKGFLRHWPFCGRNKIIEFYSDIKKPGIGDREEDSLPSPD